MNDIELNEDLEWLKRFGYRLKRLIHIKGMSQGEFAKKIGVTDATLSGYVTGNHAPNIKRIHQIARVLDCDISLLFDESF